MHRRRASPGAPAASTAAIREYDQQAKDEGDAMKIGSTPTTVAGLAEFAASQHADHVAVRFKRDGAWEERSYADVGEEIRRLALGLVELGIEPGDRVCVLANTRPEWVYMAFAIWSAGAVVVPIYPTNSPEECEWVAGNSGAVAVVCENADQLAKIAAVRDNLPELRHVLAIDRDGELGDAQLVEDIATDAGDEAELERRIAAVRPSDPFMFIYTSGTTGPPKGCVLSHENGFAACEMTAELEVIGPGDTAYLYLPLAHVFAQLIQLSAFYVGATSAYFGGDTKQIIAELQEVRPEYFPSVPRIFEKLYALGMAQLEKASEEQREQFRKAVEVGVQVRRLEFRGEPVPDDLRASFEQADELIFKGVRALFGGRMREATTGAAPIAKEILEFFYAAGVPVMEGYGMTETTGLGTSCRPESVKFGTVGPPMPRVEIRTADDGEILIKGPNVFLGYWQNEEATREVLKDGWIYTGDLGELDEDGHLRITGRKKDIIITAGGKNLTPANLENDLKQSRYISQAVMYGDRRPYPVALVTLDPEEIGPWAKEHGLPESLSELAKRPEVAALVQADLDKANEKYAQVEQIKRFAILDHDLSQETGELTPTMKVKRNVVYDRYEELFDSLYRR
jgi:long-chain acyl-CoA synthetase